MARWQAARLHHGRIQPSVPAAGIEPAAFAFSARRYYLLSYAGVTHRQSQRWESNPRIRFTRAAGRPTAHRQASPGGIEPPSPPSQGSALSVGPRGYRSTPRRNRTSTSTFGGWRPVRWTMGAFNQWSPGESNPSPRACKAQVWSARNPKSFTFSVRRRPRTLNVNHRSEEHTSELQSRFG